MFAFLCTENAVQAPPRAPFRRGQPKAAVESEPESDCEEGGAAGAVPGRPRVKRWGDLGTLTLTFTLGEGTTRAQVEEAIAANGPRRLGGPPRTAKTTHALMTTLATAREMTRKKIRRAPEGAEGAEGAGGAEAGAVKDEAPAATAAMPPSSSAAQGAAAVAGPVALKAEPAPMEVDGGGAALPAAVKPEAGAPAAAAPAKASGSTMPDWLTAIVYPDGPEAAAEAEAAALAAELAALEEEEAYLLPPLLTPAPEDMKIVEELVNAECVCGRGGVWGGGGRLAGWLAEHGCTGVVAGGAQCPRCSGLQAAP